VQGDTKGIRMKKDIIIVGGGGHAKVVIDAIRNEGAFTVKGIVDHAFPKGAIVAGVEVLGGDEVLQELYASGTRDAFIGVGTVGRYDIKCACYERLKACGFTLAIVRHPSSVIAADVVIGVGTFIAAGAIINPGVVIGENVIINTGASIDHDCRIGDYTHIAPGAILCGTVVVGQQVHIGAGAVVVQNTQIVDKSFVKAGRLVEKDLGDAHA